MKKIFLPILVLLLSATLFSTTTFAAEKGSRQNPFSAYDKNQINFQPYSFVSPKKITIQLLTLQTGTAVNKTMQRENMFNTVPASNEQWSLFKYKIGYLSNARDEQLDVNDVIPYYSSDFYFDKKFRSVEPLDIGTFGDLYGSSDLMDLSLYPGSSKVAYTAALFKKTNKYPYFRIARANGDYYWFSTDPTYKPKKTIKASKIQSIKNTKSKQIDLKWSKVSDAKYYKVFYKTGSTTKSIKVTGTSTPLKKLKKNSTYKIHVIAYANSKLYSEKSPIRTIKIKK